MNDQKQRIIDSVFSRRNAAGSLEETYVSHVKIWEDAGPEGGGRKPRYILLSQASNGTGFLHKSKLNTNGTFSVGKTWRLAELRAISVIGPLSFNITLSRTYRWQTENQPDQDAFIKAMIQLFHTVTGGSAQLRLDGLGDSAAFSLVAGRQRIQSDYLSSAPGVPSPSVSPMKAAPTKPQSLEDRRLDPQRIPSPSRNGAQSRPSSPATSTRSYGTSGRPTRNRAPSLTQLPSGRARRPSNADSILANGLASRIPAGELGPSMNGSSRPNNDYNAPPSQPAISRTATEDTMVSARSQQSLDDTLSVSSALPRSIQPSPQPSVRSRKQPTRAATVLTDVTRRDQNARISFFDPANQTLIDRLIAGPGDIDGEEENSQATMSNFEEMLEGYEMASDDIIGRKTARGAADLMEARLLDELMALEKANIHSFLESDDRIALVLQYMDGAIAELDNIGTLVSSYKIHLNAVGDDISYIQSQNRGLQVQTQNQRALLTELENLLQTVHVDTETLLVLTQGSLEKPDKIADLEEAASHLYRAMLAGRDTDMAATMERLQEYKTHNAQFCKRVFDYLTIMFTAQSKMLLGDSDGIKKDRNGRPTILPHTEFEAYTGRYSGLMLYLKEMDEAIYGRLCAAYFSAASSLHGSQMKAVFATYLTYVKKSSEDFSEQSLSTAPAAPNAKPSGMRRAGTIIRSPLDARNKDKVKNANGELLASEVLALVLEQIAPPIYHEDEFLTDFLQINDAALTFADYMNLDNYFRRQATRSNGLSSSTMKLLRGAMDLIFGFLPAELKSWLDEALAKDSMQLVGLIVTLERFLADADERSDSVLLSVVGRQHTRLKAQFDRHINEQIQIVEQTKITSKKRRGVAPFVKRFPVYIARIESQLIGADGLEIRMNVDAAYEKVVNTMFESLKQMAKMEGEGEDKGQLNFHVILIENMHHFVAETSQMEIGSVASFVRKAGSIYDENLNAYVKIILRRPFAKIIDYFEGVERLLKTTAPSEISTNNNYNRSSLKKVVKEFNAKDIRKVVDNLFKRVEKHFTEASDLQTPGTEQDGGIAPGTVMVGVWKACEEELLRITELFMKRISQCYPDSGVSLEYGPGDVEAAFRRHRA
ncbi:exocyst complex component Sec3-domain-containing protein [Lentinula aciculospora]|uniref:Exocyst complex component Sec3-domain-containing protein n=1 Tax=Lentinula aciculospora TaxID=153920 RepID=A0A9W9ANI7_9AGAR|nr:exocyst complex component Sec3-domain-containing protein [Lentinula aciculospora]